jgi:Ca2+-binding EF-hand superfamily protein
VVIFRSDIVLGEIMRLADRLRRARFRPLLIACAVLVAPAAALADEPAFADLPPFLLERMNRAGTFEDFFKALQREALRSDHDRNGLDAQDLAIAEQIEAAQYRASVVTQVLTLDLDGNGTVTTEEATRVTAYQYSRNAEEQNQEALQKNIARVVERLMAQDGNGDGMVTLSEAMSAPVLEEQRSRRAARAESLLALDPDRDGRLTMEELQQVAQQTFRAVDYDHDGTLSNNELKLLASAREFQRQLEQAMPCDLPKPASDDLVAVLGTYAGAWQPTATVAGQDETTHLAVIDIESGTQPVYLVLTSYYPMIWTFTGATERLSRVVAIRKGEKERATAGAGVIGLAADKVTFLPPGSCGRYSYKPDSKEAKLMARVFDQVTGREPDVMLGAYSPKTITVPSGLESEKTGDKDMVIVTGGGNDRVVLSENSKVKVIQGNGTGSSQEDWLADPATLLAIDPAAVLAPGKVETYEVLPSQYGLRQLVEEGKLERTEDGYRIVQPITRFPTGLAGAHAVTFYLPEGTPMPAGDLGHSQLILEKRKAP